MSLTSGGVVFSSVVGTTANPSSETRYGAPTTMGATGAAVPPGTWISTGSVNIVSADGTTHAIPGGWVTSDGVNVTAAVQNNVIIPVGKR
jgi:hypothetical protein